MMYGNSAPLTLQGIVLAGLELLVHTADVTKFTTAMLHRTVLIPILDDHDVHAQTSRTKDHASCVVANHRSNKKNLKAREKRLTPKMKNKGTLLHQSITPPHLRNVSVMREDDAQVS